MKRFENIKTLDIIVKMDVFLLPWAKCSHNKKANPHIIENLRK